MLISNNSNSVNFQAKLDVSGLKNKRWQNVAKIFEEKTSDSPKDTFILNGSFTKGIYASFNRESSTARINPKASMKLNKLPDIAIAQKLKTLFKVFKNNENVMRQANKEEKNIPNQKIATFWNGVYEKMEQDANNIFGNDKFFEMKNRKGVPSIYF